MQQIYRLSPRVKFGMHNTPENAFSCSEHATIDNPSTMSSLQDAVISKCKTKSLITIPTSQVYAHDNTGHLVKFENAKV